MNVPTMEMPREQAVRAYREYRDAVRANPNAQDRAIMLGFKALAKGQAIVDLVKVFQTCGVHEASKLPKLAVARADWEYVSFDRTYWPSVRYDFFRWPANRRGVTPSVRIDSPDLPRGWVRGRSRSVVPLIPPKLRPAGDLSGYWILFEADWRQVPGDPLLLKHLTGSLYAVLAVWDLTELERTILGHFRAESGG